MLMLLVMVKLLLLLHGVCRDLSNSPRGRRRGRHIGLRRHNGLRRRRRRHVGWRHFWLMRRCWLSSHHFFLLFFLWLELMHFWNIHHYTDGTYVHNIQISHAPKAVPTWAHKRISSGCKLVMWVWRTKYEMTQNTIKETKVIFFSLKLDMKYVINICKYVNVRVFIGSLTFLLALTSVYLLFCWLVGIS